MAKFNISWPDGELEEDRTDVMRLEGYINIPEDEKGKILMAGANVLISRLREFLNANTNDPNRKLRGTLARSLVAENYGYRVVINPSGPHHGKATKRTRAEGYHRAKTGQGRGRLNKTKHHGKTAAVNAREVGYFLEYGTPRMNGIHWMETVGEQSESEVIAAMESAYDDYLKRQGL